MMMRNPLYTALMTPFLPSGEVDFRSLEKLLRAQASCDNGVVLFGSTGEGMALDDAEKREMLTFALNLQLSIPLMVGVGGINLPKTLEWVKFCSNLPIQGFLLTNPPYARPGAKGQEHWFRSIMDASSVPCLIYNHPVRSGNPLSLSALQNLKNHPNCWGIKDSSGNIEDYSKYRAILDTPELSLYAGDDVMIPYYAPIGMEGLVSVISNIWPKETKLFLELAMKQKLIPSDLPFWREVNNFLYTAPNPIPGKALLYHLNIISSPIVRPPLHMDDFVLANKIVSIDALVKEWYFQKRKELN